MILQRVELKDLSFESIDSVLALSPAPESQRFVEPVARTIALSLVGNNLGYPGFFQVIHCDDEPVGVILLGRAPVADDEPEILQRYGYVYRLMGFFVDQRHTGQGIGRAALHLALDRLDTDLPIYLECHEDNAAAHTLYLSVGFEDINVRLDDGDLILVRFP